MEQARRGALRAWVAASMALSIGACGLFGSSDPAVSLDGEHPITSPAWPATPVPAFRPPQQGSCAPSYVLLEATCVHHAQRARLDPVELRAQLAAYRAGAASPLVGGGTPPALTPATKAAADPKDPSNLPPDALTAPRLDAKEAEAARLRELDTLIRNARIRAGEPVAPEAPAQAR